MDDPVSKFEWAQVIAASTGVVVAGLVAVVPYARRRGGESPALVEALGA